MSRLLIVVVALAGFGCTLGSAARQWFAVPAGFLATPAGGEIGVEVVEPWATGVFAVSAVGVAIVLALLWCIGLQRSRAAVFVASVWFGLLLLYPYFVMGCDRVVAGDAAWLEAEHRNMIWSGGDVNNSMEYRITGALDRLMLTDIRDEVRGTPISDWQPSEMSLARLPDLVDRIGYSDTFLEFIRFGWILALLGAALLVVWIWGSEGQINMRRSAWSLSLIGVVFVGGTLYAWGRSFVAAKHLAAAAESTARGRYEQALESLNRASAVLPILEDDTFFIRQKALLEDGLGLKTPAARLYQATLLARQGRDHQAEMVYERLIEELPVGSPIRREACRGIVRSMVNALNAGFPNRAATGFEYVLAAEPCSLKANYGLQLAYLRCRRYEEIAPLVARMDAIYDYFQLPNKHAAEFAAHGNAAAASYFLGDPSDAIVQARGGVDR